MERYWGVEWGHRIYFAHGTSAARGVAILFKKAVNLTIHDIVREPSGRYIIYKWKLRVLTQHYAVAMHPMKTHLNSLKV